MHDYVIVGAGSAGCVLANRLTEDPDVSVLLIEAGGPDTNDFVHIPAAFSALYRSAQDWDHSTGYEPHCGNRRIYLPRGKVLGGSSSINAMIYIRGNRADYDEWRDLVGPGWGYDEMLPYFKRAEDNERGADDWHGAGGPLPVANGRSMNPLSQAFIDSAQACGFRVSMNTKSSPASILARNSSIEILRSSAIRTLPFPLASESRCLAQQPCCPLGIRSKPEHQDEHVV